MRNTHLKDIRAEWKGRVPDTRYCYRLLMYAQCTVDRTGRLFFGRVSVMALALGTTPESEFKPGLGKIAQVGTLDRLFLGFWSAILFPPLTPRLPCPGLARTSWAFLHLVAPIRNP
jgi:hypothetical protein